MMTEMIAQPTAKSASGASGNAKRGSNHSVNFSMPGAFSSPMKTEKTTAPRADR